MNQSQAHANSFLFALLDLQADGAFQDGVSLVGFPDEEPETFIAFLQDLACCSFFSKGTSSIDVVLKKEGQGKSQIEEALNKFVPFLKSEGLGIAIRFDEEWAPASFKRPPIVYAADEDIDRGRATDVFMPGNLPSPEKAYVEKEYGFRLGHAEAWLDKSFDGKAINFPGEIYLAPRPFERKEKGWQKAYSALFAYSSQKPALGFPISKARRRRNVTSSSRRPIGERPEARSKRLSMTWPRRSTAAGN